MNFLKVVPAVLALVLCSVFLSPDASAQSTFLRRTNVTFSGPVAIPGRILPAGSYVFQLMPGNETNLVIIRDKSENAIATLLTIPDYRLTPTGGTVITYKEQAANTPQAVRAWFYPGENYGHEFAYPRKVAVQLAVANHENVPAIPDQTADNNLTNAKVTTVTPSEAQAEVSQTNSQPDQSQAATSAPASAADNNSNTNSSNNLVAQNRPLPKTASSTSLIALIGILSLCTSGILGLLGRRFRNHEERTDF